MVFWQAGIATFRMKKITRTRAKSKAKSKRRLSVHLDAHPEIRDALDRAVKITRRDISSIVLECLEIGLRRLAPVTEAIVRAQFRLLAEEAGITENQLATELYLQNFATSPISQAPAGCQESDGGRRNGLGSGRGPRVEKGLTG